MGNYNKNKLSKIQRKQHNALRLAYSWPTWKRVNDFNELENIETVNKTVKTLIADHLSIAKSRHRKIENLVRKH